MLLDGADWFYIKFIQFIEQTILFSFVKYGNLIMEWKCSRVWLMNNVGAVKLSKRK